LCEVQCPKALLSKTYKEVCTLPMLLILGLRGRHLPEAYGALGSGGLERSDVDLGGCLEETVIEGLLSWFRIRRDETCKPG
jgi:hypothetical protein